MSSLNRHYVSCYLRNQKCLFILPESAVKVVIHLICRRLTCHSITAVTNKINDDPIPLKYAGKPASRRAGTGTPDWNGTSF